jgi:hypothetical protein
MPNMICKKSKECPMAVKKIGKDIKNQEFCYHMLPHVKDNGCHLVTCGHMRNIECGCIETELEIPKVIKEK